MWARRHPVLAGWTAFVVGHAVGTITLASAYAAGWDSGVGLTAVWYVVGWLASLGLCWLWFRGEAFGTSWARRQPLAASLACMTIASFPPFAVFGWLMVVLCFWLAFREPRVRGA
ncbi:MAG: hypothetical protein QW212_00625 [Nitrososphaerales archaeon]